MTSKAKTAKTGAKRVAKYSVDIAKLTTALKKETSVTDVAKQMGLPTEAKPYVYNAIKRMGDKVVKVSPGVYKLA